MKKHFLAVFIPGIFLLYFNYGNYWSSHWYTKWTLLVYLFSACFAWLMGMAISFYLFPLLLVTLLSAAWLSVWNFNPYLKMMDMETFTSIGKNGLYAYLTIVMCALTVAYLPRRYAPAIRLYLPFVALISAVYTLIKWTEDFKFRGAFSGNPSMNGCLMAALLPLVQYWPSKYRVAVLPVIVAIFMTGASNSVGVLAAVAISLLVASLKPSFKSLMITLSVGALIFTIGFYTVSDDFLGSSGRFYVWKPLFTWWINQPWMWLTGSGVGSGVILFPWLQDLLKINETGYFLWLHSDWLQILFEGGALALLSACLAGVYIGVKAFGRPYLFASYMGFVATGIFNYPVRLPISCTCLTLIVWLILENPRQMEVHRGRSDVSDVSN